MDLFLPPLCFLQDFVAKLLAPQLPEEEQVIFPVQRALTGHTPLKSDGCLGQTFSLDTSFCLYYCVCLVL